VPSVVRGFFAGLILAVLGAGLASAQNIDFQLFVTANGTSGTVLNDATIPILGQVGTQTTATVVATYTGSSQATISKPTSVGSIEVLTLSVPSNPTYPVTLTPGQTFTFVVTYQPTNATAANLQVEVPYTEPGTTTTAVSNAILLLFSGVTPVFTLDYFLAPADNEIPISSGGTIQFVPATQLNTTATGGLQISNTGTGPGGITGISISTSSVFKLSQVPAASPQVPFTLPANGSITIGISYTPTAVETDTAQITINYQSGQTATINLSGSGTTSTFSYSYFTGTATGTGTGTTPTSVKPGGVITLLPGVPLATSGTTVASSTANVQVTNTGGSSGTLNAPSISGPGFQLVSSGTIFPITLAPGATISFTISYTPTQVGTQTGTLAIGGAVFTVSGEGIGPQLSFSYVSNGTTIPVGTGGAVAFVPIAVGQSEKVTFMLTNSGTSTATISLIGTSTPFSVTPPALPLTLPSGQSASFPITFTPTTTGPENGTLLINNTSVSLLGLGDTPAPLPSYTFTGPSGSVSPATQSNVSLTLSQSYSAALTGTLTITTEGSLGSDPAVQFISGGRTVDFTIPAGSTSANFAGEGSQIEVQTGTVAETVTLTPTFATTGGVDVTPSSPTTLQFTIPSLAPGLTNVQVTAAGASSFTLSVVGYSTTRTLTSLNVTFNPASGFNLAATQFPFNVSQQSSVWFQSAGSIAYGGQFQIAVTFNLTGSVTAPETLLDAIASVSATVSNSIGTSGSLQAPVQ
jgi:hypothetical protein